MVEPILIPRHREHYTYRCKVCGWECRLKKMGDSSVPLTKTGHYGNEGTPIPTMHVDEMYVASTISFVLRQPISSWYRIHDGVEYWNGNAWVNINTGTPVNMVCNSKYLFAAFSGAGLWRYDLIDAWQRINTVIPVLFVVSQDNLYADFGEDGTWVWMGPDGTDWEIFYTPMPDADPSVAALTDNNPIALVDSAKLFGDKHFSGGTPIRISTTSGTNDGDYTIAERGVTGGEILLSSSNSLTTEDSATAGEVTISRLIYKPNVTTGCPNCGSLHSR
jgi:hypothetical protein